MATKKPHRPSRTTNGEPAPKEPSPTKIARQVNSAEEPVVEQAPKAPGSSRMTKAQLERRVHALEGQIARLNAELEEIRGPQEPWWEKIVGIYANDPAFDEAMRLGREWRESFRPKKRSSKKKSPKKKSPKAKSADGRS
jgi:hypothetical protein